MGFIQGNPEKRLFHKEDIILIVHVDDILYFGCTSAAVNFLLDEIKSEFNIAFVYMRLGVNGWENGKAALVQSGLTQKIIDTVLAPISQSKARGPETTPAGKLLGLQQDHPYFNPVKFGFKYRRVIGMMMYLINTRSDLQIAVHQCACFSHNPRIQAMALPCLEAAHMESVCH